MKINTNFSQRQYAFFLIFGASILLFRTVTMISQGYLKIMLAWAAALLFLEFLLDLGWMLSSIRWWITNDKTKSRMPLRLAAAAIILHAVRVFIFVLGRFEPWINFEIRPEYRMLQHTKSSWGWVYFAAIMSVLGVVGVIIVWRKMVHSKKNQKTNSA